MWDLLSCPVGTVGWPQAQLSMPGAAEAVLSYAGHGLGMGPSAAERHSTIGTGSGTHVHHMYTHTH